MMEDILFIMKNKNKSLPSYILEDGQYKLIKNYRDSVKHDVEIEKKWIILFKLYFQMKVYLMIITLSTLLVGSVISAWGFHILNPSKYTSFVPPYSFKFHLSFNTLNSFIFSFFSTI